jgi:hypothetical protein
MTVDYDLALSKHSTAPAGSFTFGVELGMPPEVVIAPTASLVVEISWNGGSSWEVATLTGCSTAGCTVQVTNQRRGSASLRVTATDTAGRSVTQTVIDAYAVS